MSKTHNTSMYHSTKTKPYSHQCSKTPILKLSFLILKNVIHHRLQFWCSEHLHSEDRSFDMYIIPFQFITGLFEYFNCLIITRCGSGAGPGVKGTLPHIFMMSPSGWKVSSQALLTNSDIVKYPAWNHSAISWLLKGPEITSTNTHGGEEEEGRPSWV